MLKYLTEPLNLLVDTIKSLTADNMRVSLVQIGLSILVIAVVVGLCFLFIYWGMPIVGDVFSIVGKGAVAA